MPRLPFGGKMKADVIVDLQYGSTGKGAVAAYLTRKRKYACSIRAQSIQAGHTVEYKGKFYKMRTIPCAWVDRDVQLWLAPGAFIEKNLLLREIEMVSEATGEDVRKRLLVDYRAFYVTEEDVRAEEGLDKLMGSTAHGAGASLIRKLWRKGQPTRVKDDGWAAEHGITVFDAVLAFDRGTGLALVEGCQGTMLSIHTSPHWPFVTSRECTASGILAECGIPPKAVNQVLGVFRTLPIRVGGNSGPAAGRELSWDEVNERCGRKVEPERTTVTNRVRRIFEFSPAEFNEAVMLNRPDELFMTFADYLAPCIHKAKIMDHVGDKAKKEIRRMVDMAEFISGVKVVWMGTGDGAEDFIEM